jgi:hypothetical protein
MGGTNAQFAVSKMSLPGHPVRPRPAQHRARNTKPGYELLDLTPVEQVPEAQTPKPNPEQG